MKDFLNPAPPLYRLAGVVNGAQFERQLGKYYAAELGRPALAATGLIYRKLNPPAAVVEERPRIAGLVMPPSDEAMRNGREIAYIGVGPDKTGLRKLFGQ